MDAIPTSLERAALAAQNSFAKAARDAAAAGAGSGGFARTQASMSAAARSAVFADALLGAMRARLAELKLVTR